MNIMPYINGAQYREADEQDIWTGCVSLLLKRIACLAGFFCVTTEGFSQADKLFC